MRLQLPFCKNLQTVSAATSVHSVNASFIIVFVATITISFSAANAQSNQTTEVKPSHINIVTDRSAKIVNTLSIKDSAIYKQVLALLIEQYSNINRIHDESKLALIAIKQQSNTAQESALQVQQQEETKRMQLQQLHNVFLAGLQKDLTEGQIELVKDGMTYGVLNTTYTAYEDMIPSLTEVQKKKIYDWLIEARELAMDGESSEKKHAIFGKYKGRINNYLSAAGYDLVKERDEWQKRINAKKESSK